MSTTVQNFFTMESFATFGGASLAVLILTNTVRRLTKFNHPLVAFVFSQFVAFFGASGSNSLGTASHYFITFLNGCLLFCSAAGINETASKIAEPAPPPGSVKPHGAQPAKWLSSWYRR
jgi:hypothetical protein